MMPELHRPIAMERIGPSGLDVLVEANAAECAALAERLRLPAVLSLTCRFHLQHPVGDVVMAHGHLVAEVVQTCVVSLEDFSAIVEERFALRWVPEGEESADVDPESPDEIAYEDGTLDLGEAAAQQFGLALDPYPRAPGAALPSIEPGPEHPAFARLAGLKRPN